MKDKDTVYDLLFDEPSGKYADEKYIADKLDGITRSFRAIRGNWHTLNPYLQSIFKVIEENERQQAIFRWAKENGEL